MVVTNQVCNTIGDKADIDTHARSSRLAEFGGRGMSFNICRGTLGSLAIFTAIRNVAGRKMNIARQGPDSRRS